MSKLNDLKAKRKQLEEELLEIKKQIEVENETRTLTICGSSDFGFSISSNYGESWKEGINEEIPFFIEFKDNCLGFSINEAQELADFLYDRINYLKTDESKVIKNDENEPDFIF